MAATDLNVLYEDNHVIGVIKPPGILSQADGAAPAGVDMLSIIGEYLRVKYQKPGNVFVGLVHRLDRNVGGTMLFAKTSKGASRLSEEMRSGRFRKGYFALAEGRLEGQTGTSGVLIDDLYKEEKRNIVVRDSAKGKKSVLVYQIVEYFGEHTLVFAVPVTGRTHQIRAQLAFAGHPLADDVKYGGTRVTQGPVSFPALWSSLIFVKHPTKGEMLSLSSVPFFTPPWNCKGGHAIIDRCSKFLEGMNEYEFDRLCGIWR